MAEYPEYIQNHIPDYICLINVKLSANIAAIKKGILEYLDEYIHHVNGTNDLHPREFMRKYRYTSLKYFHSELGI